MEFTSFYPAPRVGTNVAGSAQNFRRYIYFSLEEMPVGSLRLWSRKWLLLILWAAMILAGCGGGSQGETTTTNREGETGVLAPQPSSFSVTLAWDGSPEPGVRGYKIYYGTNSGKYDRSVDVGKVQKYTIRDLPRGTYYFAVTAYMSPEIESDFSNEVSAPPPL